ncbi:MAG TPA: 6-bladed beta-propeller [Parapedobacter sp.]|uniref:6-bladed beta-propeller n=1 Tax=Parapedobacter sp. TaxID=1958893 RepID=UPI002CAFFA9E|nr:6-bladed beta-propeller [Parapedobacter sp.]HWK59768.1 6-bladed beta-propeller [Parapedobacter sp.]
MKYLSLITGLLLFIGCGTGDESSSNRGTLPTIDESQAEESKLSDFFSDFAFVFLETSSESLLATSVSKMMVLDRYLFIMDRTPPMGKRRVMSFDKYTGAFLGQIGTEGKGPEEYAFLVDFTIDPERKAILLYSHSGDDQRMLTYTLDGSFVGATKAKDVFFLQGMAIQDSVYVVANDALVNRGYYMLKVNRSDLSIADQKLEVNRAHFKIGEMSSYQARFLFWHPTDTIYDVTADEPVPIYAVRLPEDERAERKEIIRRPTHDLKIEKNVELFNAGKISSRMSFFEGANYLSYLKITRTEEQMPIHQTVYLFDKRDNRLYDSDHMDYDLFGGYRLPFLLEMAHADEYVGIIDPIRLLSVGKKEFLDKVPLTEEDHLRFSKLDEMANPIVLFLKEK